ncbi:MAG: hypothetical protein KGL10_02820 [Alphaproteobacteria bacterium]|nr:hypothetical protein [Alphaproteobacteria bacterium]MDE2336223.1 hypothetical protein [Alphaproteobacteria bacterium]
MDFKQFNMAAIQKYTSPQAIKDFDRFLDNLPVSVGYNALIAAGLVCLMGATSVWFSSVELDKVSKLHADLTNVQALKPPVPVLKYLPVSETVLKPLSKKISDTFKGVSLVPGSGEVKVSAQDTDYFPQFLAAISYLEHGGRNWKVSTSSLCVGTDCKGAKLYADLKVNIVEFSEPTTDNGPVTKSK